MYFRRAQLAALLLLLTLGCGEGETTPDPRLLYQRFEAALQRNDLDEAIGTISLLREVLPESADTRLRIAELLKRAGDSLEALWLLEASARRYPSDARIPIALATTAISVGDPNRALRALIRVRASEGNGEVAVLLEARARLELGELEPALQVLEQAESDFPKSVRVRRLRIQTLIQELRYAEALGQTQAALELEFIDDSQRRWLELTHADLLSVQGNRAAALQSLRDFLGRRPLDAMGWAMRVRLLAAEGQADLAFELLSEAMQESPQHFALHAVMALVQRSRGDPDAAEATLRELADRDPGPNSVQSLAHFLHEQGRSHEAAELVAELNATLASFAPQELAYLEVALRISAGDLDAAQLGFRRFRARYPRDPRGAYLRARFEIERGQYAAAVARLRAVLPRLDRADVHHWLAVALEGVGDHESAEYRYGLAIGRARSQIASYRGILRVLQRRGAWERVPAFASTLLQLAPAESTGYEALARAMRARGDNASALQILRAYAERFSDEIPPLVALSRALRSTGSSKEALALLEAHEPRFGSEAVWQAERALALEGCGRREEGLAALEASMSPEPADYALHHARAQMMYRAGQVERASRDVEILLELDPRDPGPLRMSGDFHSRAGQWQRAANDYRRFLSIRPSDATVQFHHGVALEQLGEAKTALQAYQQAVQLDPTQLGARNNLALLHAEEGRAQAALTAAQANFARAPDNGNVLDTLGWIYHQQGHGSRARGLLERAVHTDPKSAEYRQHLEVARTLSEQSIPVRKLAAEPPPAAGSELRAKLAELRRPNLVLIVVDALRADATSPYGAQPGITPELQRWADRGVVFENALAQSSWTKVSMASLFASLWPRSHGLRLATDGLGTAASTLAEELRSGGYRTYAVQSNGWLEQSFGFHQGFDHYVFPRGSDDASLERRGSLWPHGQRVLNEAARLLKAHTGSEPFLLYLHLMDVHEYAAPPEFKHYGDTERGAYRAALRWVDNLLEQLREQLAAAGALENSVLIVASDHGEAFGENGAWGHARNVLTPVLEVPLILRFPFSTQGLRIQTQVRNIDIAPTLLELASLPIPAHFEGASLLSLLDQAEAPDRINFADLGAAILPGARAQVAVNDGGWTLARSLDEPAEELLFDRQIDAPEDANVIDFMPAQAQRMRALLNAHRSGAALPELRQQQVRIDPQIAARLRALGYLE